MKKTTIQKDFTTKIALFVITMMGTILIAVAVMMTNALQGEHQRSMAAEAYFLEEVLENYLSYQKENIVSLAQNDFIINSLVDVTGREKYLATLIDGFIKARKVAAVTVVDFEGKIIRANTASPPDYLRQTDLRSTLELGRPKLELAPGRQRFIFIEPIFYYQTPQGALIMEIEFERFGSQAISYKQDLSYRIFQREIPIFVAQNQPGDYLTINHEFSPDAIHLRQLGLHLEVGILKSSYLDLVENILLWLSLLGLIILILSVLLAERVASRLVKPILTLCERVKEKDIFCDQAHGPLGTNNELEDLAEAFDERNIRLRKAREDEQKAERKIALAFERFKVVMDGIDALVYVADMETYELLFINKFGQEKWGEGVGKPCWQYLQKNQSGPCSFCTNDKLIAPNGQPNEVFVWEAQNTRDNRWYQCRDQAIRWTDNRWGRMEIAVDITEQKYTEMALADEKERLAVTLRSIGDGVITTDTEGNIDLINMVAERLTGWRQPEAKGKKLTDVFNIINEKTRQPCESPVEKVMSTGQVVGLANHTVLVARDGREMTIADSGAPIRDRENHIIGVVLVFRDVTEAMLLEEQAVKSKKLESIGVLAGGIAHDFNNMLAAILGNINLSLTDKSLSSKTMRRLAEAEKAALRAKGLTQQLLTFSKGGEPVKQTESISEIVRDSANFILHGSEVVCRYNIQEDLWLTEVDKGQISQVIQNLILNAKQAMPAGGAIAVSCENVASLPVDIPLPHDSSYIKIAIKDSGIGITKEKLDKIFDPYFTTKEEGSGLGLAITHSIILKHNGHISVQSISGEGTTFTIFLPATEVDRGPQVLAEKATEDQVKSANILVMDDDEQIREMSREMISSLGHQVILVKDGEEAIHTYEKYRSQKDRIDIVIMDLTVPGGMGGKEAVQKIIKMDPQAKIIVTSGYSNDSILANYQDYGFCAAIVKPFLLTELSQALHRALCE